MDTVFVGYGFNHKVRCVSDIRVRSHKYRAAGDGSQHLHRNGAERGLDSVCKIHRARSRQEYEVRRRIVKEARQSACRPEHLKRFGEPEASAHALEQHKRRLHGDENTDK